MSELWWLWALCSSILAGMMVYANQIFKMPSSLMMVCWFIAYGGNNFDFVTIRMFDERRENF